MSRMIFVIFMLCSARASADYKFHYGDIVEVYSSAWKKPCYTDEFVNVCRRKGTVLSVAQGSYCERLYTVRFEFEGLGPTEQTYCEAHLSKFKHL